MTAISFTTTNISADWDRGAILQNFIAAVDLVIGNAVYLDSNNKLRKAVSDSSAHANAIGIVVGAPNFYGETTILAGDYAAVCISGPVSGYTGLANGQLIWVGATAGAPVDTAPTPNAYQYVIGEAVGADTVFVRPGIGSPTSV